MSKSMNFYDLKWSPKVDINKLPKDKSYFFGSIVNKRCILPSEKVLSKAKDGKVEYYLIQYDRLEFESKKTVKKPKRKTTKVEPDTLSEIESSVKTKQIVKSKKNVTKSKNKVKGDITVKTKQKPKKSSAKISKNKKVKKEDEIEMKKKKKKTTATVTGKGKKKGGKKK